MEIGETYRVTNKYGKTIELEEVDLRIKVKSGPKWKNKTPKVPKEPEK